MRVSSHSPQSIGVKEGFYRPTKIARDGAMHRRLSWLCLLLCLLVTQALEQTFVIGPPRFNFDKNLQENLAVKQPFHILACF